MQVASSAIQDFTSRMATHVAAFDACYEATAESGEIFDFEFDRALMWHPDPSTDCIDWAAALVSALAERVSDEVSFCVSLHAGEPMVANWGATHRFRRMLLGPDVEYARMAASEGLKNGTTTVITESLKNAGLEGQIEPIGVYGIVGAGTTRLYRVV